MLHNLCCLCKALSNGIYKVSSKCHFDHVTFIICMYKCGCHDVHSRERCVQNQFDCSASRVLARGRRPDKVSGRILPFSRSHKGFSCIIFAGARRGIASSERWISQSENKGREGAGGKRGGTRKTGRRQPRCRRTEPRQHGQPKAKQEPRALLTGTDEKRGERSTIATIPPRRAAPSRTEPN